MAFTTKIYKSWENHQKEKISEIRKSLGPLFDSLVRGKILDLGCGNGYLEKDVKGDFIGIDLDYDMLKNRITSFPCVLGDGSYLPFPKETFDSVVCMDTIHLLKSNDFLRVTKRGGFLLISIFFNENNYKERKNMIKDKTTGFIPLMEFETNTRERELVFLGVKE